jgi:RNA polymerase sigma-70 factor (ECF subfamily)
MTSDRLDLVSDEELVRQAQQDPGSTAGRAAASRLFRRHQDRLYAWCYYQVRDRERALDLAQDTLLAALRALPTFEGRSRFCSWLFAIARYRHISSVRAPRLQMDEEVELEAIPCGESDPEAAFVRREEEERVLALCDHVLEPDERLALQMRYVECKPLDEITRLLRITMRSGARGLLQKALRKVRASLESEGGIA